MSQCLWAVNSTRVHFCTVYQFAWAATIKSYRLGVLKRRNLFSHNPEGWDSEIKVSAGLVLVRPLCLPCRWWSSLHLPSVCLCPNLLFLSCWIRDHPSEVILIIPSKTVFRCSHILRDCGLGLQHVGDTVQPINRQIAPASPRARQEDSKGSEWEGHIPS